MAKVNTTYHNFSQPTDADVDEIEFEPDFGTFKNHVDLGMSNLASAVSGSPNVVGGTSYESNAGKIISSVSGEPYGRVLSLAAAADAAITFQDHPADPTTGTDKFTMGYRDSSDTFELNPGATLDSSGLTMDISGNMGLGIATPDQKFHVHSGSAGSVSADGDTDLVVEHSSHGGIHILTPDSSNSIIYFGSPTDALGARIFWNHDADLLRIGTHNAGAELSLDTGVGVGAVRIDSSGNVIIGTTTALGVLRVGDGSSSGRDAIVLSADSPRAYWATADTKTSWRVSAQDAINNGFEISYGGTDTDPTDDAFTQALVILSTGLVGINETAPAFQLHVNNDGGSVDTIVANAVMLVSNTSATSDNAGLNLQSGNAANCFLQMGDNDDGDRGGLTYHNDAVSANEYLAFRVAGEKVRITQPGNLGINTTTFDGTSVACLTIANSTAPAAGTANQIYLYEVAGELWVMDAGSGTTQLSPHDRVTGEWIFYSKKNGEHLYIRVEAILRWVVGTFEDELRDENMIREWKAAA